MANCPKCGTPITGSSPCCPVENDGVHHSNHNCKVQQRRNEGKKK